MGSSQCFAETYCTSGQRYTQMERVCFYRMPVTTPGFYVDITYKVTVQMSTSMAASCQNACLPAEFIQTCPLPSGQQKGCSFPLTRQSHLWRAVNLNTKLRKY